MFADALRFFNLLYFETKIQSRVGKVFWAVFPNVFYLWTLLLTSSLQALPGRPCEITYLYCIHHWLINVCVPVQPPSIPVAAGYSIRIIIGIFAIESNACMKWCWKTMIEKLQVILCKIDVNLCCLCHKMTCYFLAILSLMNWENNLFGETARRSHFD